MEALISNIRKKATLTSELVETIGQSFQTEEVEKGTILLKDGQYCRKLFFLESGTARTFYLHDGKEVTSWMYREGMFLTAWYSFLQQQPSFETIEILEHSVIHYISYSKLHKLYREHPEFEHFGRKLVEEQLAFIDYFSKGYMFLSAKERYDLLQSIFPDVTLRIKLGHIASFLGVSQETLSRIRKK